MRSLTNLLVLLLIATAGYYGYTKYQETAVSSAAEPSAPPGYNCRGAMASLTQLYECRTAPSCTLTTEQESELTETEINIERFCN